MSTKSAVLFLQLLQSVGSNATGPLLWSDSFTFDGKIGLLIAGCEHVTLIHCIWLCPTTESVAQQTESSSDDDYSAEELAIAVAVTLIGTAVIVGVTVGLIALCIFYYRTRKNRGNHASNGVKGQNYYDLPLKQR